MQKSILQQKADLIRKWCLISTTEAGSGHPTSCLSIADVMAVLFETYLNYDIQQPLNLNNDRVVFSKGHAAPLLYTLFGIAGAYPLEDLKTLRKLGSPFEGHPMPRFKYAESATGSLGQGLSVGVGLALLAKRENLPFKTYVLCGDGELAEGQIWEAANFASKYQLDNLIAILDINRLGQSGETMFGHHMDAYAKRFESFGFDVTCINGHSYEEATNAFQHSTTSLEGKPHAILCKTYKGKGISFLENKDGWHGKALDKEQLQKALEELDEQNDHLSFKLKVPPTKPIPSAAPFHVNIDIKLKKEEKYATRKVFGEVLAQIGAVEKQIYVLDGDVKNSTFTDLFSKSSPDRFVECYIAEQHMVSLAVGLSRLGKTPFVTTFGAFFSRAADQIRMARISEANIKFVGSHVGVSIGEDGPSQMALEDIALFGALPDTIILQPADAISMIKLMPLIANRKGFVYMRTLRAETPLLYNETEDFSIGGSKILRQSTDDILTVAATGITVFEALKAADKLTETGTNIRVVDCYSINPIDIKTLEKCIHETKLKALITVEDHFQHGGMGDFIGSGLASLNVQIEKMAVTKISESGKMDELLNEAKINAAAIIERINSVINI